MRFEGRGEGQDAGAGTAETRATIGASTWRTYANLSNRVISLVRRAITVLGD